MTPTPCQQPSKETALAFVQDREHTVDGSMILTDLAAAILRAILAGTLMKGTPNSSVCHDRPSSSMKAQAQGRSSLYGK
jgi:hypothetical protein